MAKSNRFWDKLSRRYEKSPVANEAAYQKKLEITRGFLKPEMEILEFGCGTGTTAVAHAPYVKHIQAIDFSSKMLEFDKAKAAAAKVENVTFEHASIDKFSVGDETFDVVLGLSILHLLKNKEDVIAKVHKMLKPGGVFISNTVCIGNTMKFFSFIAPIGKSFGVLPVLNIFTTKELETSVTAAGFEIEQLWQPSKKSAVFIVAKKRA